ncbi:MAG TPA: glycosyltransferase family 39 protein [Candidatus Polarisedimenticolia bacterium]|nr:glycosyltransferase family 39 protein [Candidatus Polarisedimenticolia bacterium]
MSAAARGFRRFPFYGAALAAALSGQGLLLAGGIAAGAILHLAAAALVAWGSGRRGSAAAAPVSAPRRPLVLLALLIAAAFAVRRYAIGSIPWGLNNDEGIEGLIACRFLAGERIAPFSSIGLSRETLFHVLLMPLFGALGPGIVPLRLLSLAISLATLPILYLAGRKLFSEKTGLLAAALLAVSPWHLLYSRTGLRNILLPAFVLASIAGFRIALETRRTRWFVILGAILGIGMYSYTSFRIVPPLLAAWAFLRRFTTRERPLGWKETAAIAIPFALLLVPQMAYAREHPAEIFTRGAYVLGQTPQASLPANVWYALLMPGFYPARYGVMQSLYYFGDGVSLVYAAIGRFPETAVSAALMACGLVLVMTGVIRRRSEGDMVLLLFLGGTIVTVGLAGPSLTRLIGNLPLFCLTGGRFLEELEGEMRSRFSARLGRGAVAALLTAAGLLCGEQYFARAGTSRRAMFYFAATQTLMGGYVAHRPPDHPIYVLYSEEPETLQFLTFPRRRATTLLRDPAALDLERIRSMPGRKEFVVENHGRFRAVFEELRRTFPDCRRSVLSDARRGDGAPVAFVLEVGDAAPGAGVSGPARGSAAPLTGMLESPRELEHTPASTARLASAPGL